MRAKKQHEHSLFTAGRNYSPYGSPSIPNNLARTPGDRSSSPPPKVNHTPKPKSQSNPKPIYTEKHETAASVIQQKFRILQSLRTVSAIASEFQALKNTFEYPSVIDFQGVGTEEGHISVLTTRAPSEFDKVEEGEKEQMEVDGQLPKLAYTAVNYSVHSYVDAMERLLMRLDGVESWGDKGVRESRRSAVREIGKETVKLERFWKHTWMDYVEKQREGVSKEGKEWEESPAELQERMEIDEEPVHVEVEDNDGWLDVAELAPVGDARN
jgi:hypothetical protein